jgi:hypothetical protein
MAKEAQISTVSKNVANNASVGTSITIFDSFYNNDLIINAADYDIVYSYFVGITGNKIIGANYATLLFRIAQQGNYNVLQLLQIIQGTGNLLQLNSVMCYYLNTFRSKVSLYGIAQIPNPNQAVQRNVVL